MTHSSKLSVPASTPTRPPSLLSRILETPALVKQIQSLPAHTLLQLVNQVGLEDSSELLALATTPQLTRMVDEDLWRQARPGAKEEFSSERLGVWLRALEEMGATLAAEKLSEMDEDFLAFAFSQYLHCLELEALQYMLMNVQGDHWEDSRLENLLESQNSHELGEHLVLAKATAPWDTLLSLLLALDDCDTSLCGRLLRRLAASTEEKAEKEGGLFEVLSGEEMLESDASSSRHQRRTADGFVPAEDALAFMAWSKGAKQEELLAMKGRDPVSRAYFREMKGEQLAQSVRNEQKSAHDDSLLRLLGEAEEENIRKPLLLSSDNEESQLFRRAAALSPSDRERFLLDLNFLAQAVLLTEETAEGKKTRPLRQAEAADFVLAACERGLAALGGAGKNSLNAIQLFSLGRKT